MLAGAVIGFGISTYETAVNGVDWAKDEAHWLAGAANDTYCWLKHGVYPTSRTDSSASMKKPA
jgi:hypothetical protein